MSKILWYSGKGEMLTFEHAKEQCSLGNILKYDGYRESHHWTVVGPKGRVGDYDTWDEAISHLNDDV